ncbi:MAG: hypothetical protein ABGX04_12490 [Myxococcales bacterium]
MAQPTPIHGYCLLLVGWLSGALGAKAFLVSATLAAMGGLLAWLSRYFQTRKVAGED